MKKTHLARLAVFVVIAVSLPIAACNFSLSGMNGGDEDTVSSSSSSSEEASVPTPNVSYTGMLEELGVSVFMQGTHKLTLDDGQIIVLQSTDANLTLDSYIGRKVEVRGSVEPTVEAGGTLMRVTEVVVLIEEISSSSPSSDAAASASSARMCGGIAGIACGDGEACVDDPSDSCDPSLGGADCSGICVQVIASSSSSTSAAPSSVSSSVSSSSRSTSSSSSSLSSAVSSSSKPANTNSPEMEQQVVTMSKQNYTDAGLWTQKYCTSHIGFCIPVHKNWYFKSFGATTSNLWHVEFGMNTIDELGQGAIILNLVSGTSASMNASDGQIRTQGADVIGFKDASDGRHFELIADQRLRGAVEYMLAHITPYELAQ